jgi:hypothetical protein
VQTIGEAPHPLTMVDQLAGELLQVHGRLVLPLHRLCQPL